MLCLGTVVATLTVTSNESVTYSLASTYNFPDGNSPFEINENNEIVVSGSLDRELVDVYVLDVKAETQTSPPLTTYTNFTVQIMDENDNVPEFECSPYHVAVSENVIEGTSFMRVIAKDRDVGQVRFSLRRNSPSLSDMEMPFNINSHTGWITTSVKLDRELVSSYSLIVVATDSGNPPLSSTTTVKIDVKDYNDNPPVFFQNLYRAAGKGKEMSLSAVLDGCYATKENNFLFCHSQ